MNAEVFSLLLDTLYSREKKYDEKIRFLARMMVITNAFDTEFLPDPLHDQALDYINEFLMGIFHELDLEHEIFIKMVKYIELKRIFNKKEIFELHEIRDDIMFCSVQRSFYVTQYIIKLIAIITRDDLTDKSYKVDIYDSFMNEEVMEKILKKMPGV